MSRVEVIGNTRLYHGDMREILPALDPVDMICSDVPYLLQSGGNTTEAMGGKFSHDNYDNSGEIIPCDIDFSEFMPLCFNVMPRGHAYFMVNNRNVSLCQNEAEAAGFYFHNLLTWDKGIATPNRWYMKNLEFTVMMKSGKAFRINNCGGKQSIKCPPPKNSIHDTQKPVALMEHYIRNSSVPKQTVLDPFMGSGTTGVACVNLDRHFIGIELVEKHFDNACRRIESAVNTPSLFGVCS